MQSIGSKLDLGFVLDLLHLDDHEFSRQVVARLSRSQDCPSGALSLAQVKDLVLDNMIIALGSPDGLGPVRGMPRTGRGGPVRVRGTLSW